ncbi:MAG TPA: helicase C-terminal domain-containing protein [Streptosporangiaceae bacterium]|nr:helicase C-terminal domain-containing protein [Streptosporangiaceae bacterium]
MPARGPAARHRPQRLDRLSLRVVSDPLSPPPSTPHPIASTKELAAALSSRARADLITLGIIRPGGVTLADGNTAGVADLVQARHNDRRIRDADGRPVANRDVWKIEAIERGSVPARTAVIMRRDLGPDPDSGMRRWGAPMRVPARYLNEHAVLAYATTVHAAEGRTVDTCHALVGGSLSRALLYVAMSRGREANHAYVSTEPAAADLRPGTTPVRSMAAPGLEPSAKTEQDGPWAPPADRFSVLADALERDEADRPALEVLRAELARAGHLAHLGAIWTDLVGQDVATQYDTIVSRELGTADYDRYIKADARATLHRQVRAAELAGHDPAELLARAVRMLPLDDTSGRGRAEDIAKVLHWRVRELAGPDAPRAASYADRTPETGDPQTDRYLRELAALMDQRTADLGERAAADPPAWAVEHLGPVPNDPLRRLDWAGRAGTAAAYRERYGRTDPRDVLGREPAAPEARADWRAARAALGLTRGQADLAAASTGELWARRARYERELAWAPPHVGNDLRAAALARREHATEARLIRAQARTASPRQRAERLASADSHQQLADSLAFREAALSEIDTQRASWHDATAQARADAREATEELRRRLPGADLRPFHDQPRERARAAERAQQTQKRSARPAQLEYTSAELRRALELADRARRTLDAQHQARRQVERERQREADEPSPARWPHRDPGYDYDAMRQRQAGRTPARVAAQDFPAAVPDLAAAHSWASPGAGRSSTQHRQLERDEPEATL